MTAQRGSEFLLKIGNGGSPEAFTTIGGFRTNTLRINNEIIDVTSKDSGGKRQLLPEAGVQSLSASGSGVFVDDAAFAAAHAACLNNQIKTWQVAVPDFGTYTGPFQISSLEFSGEHKGEQTYAITLESAGNIAFAAA